MSDEHEMIEDSKKNSDSDAKKEYVKVLKEEGYVNILIKASPADIIAEKNQEKYYFEIKATSTKENTAWWGVSVTEWMGARDNPGRYFFVLAIKRNGKYEFEKYKPQEILEVSDIPPFRSTFRYHMRKNQLHKAKKKTAVKLTEDKITRMNNLYKDFKQEMT